MEKVEKTPRKVFDASPYGSFFDDRDNPVQAPIELQLSSEAQEVVFRIPSEWNETIQELSKRLKVDPEFLYRKAFQAFFGFKPAIFDDDGYLKQWREVFDLDGENALRPHIQEQDDLLTKRMIRMIRWIKKGNK